MAKRVKRIPKKFKKGDRIFYLPRTDRAMIRGTVYGFRAWGFANGKNTDDGYTPHYQVVWDDYAHREGAHRTDLAQHDIEFLPVIDRLAEIKTA